MELIYRGIKYTAEDPKLPAKTGEADNNKISRRQSNQIKISPNFPLFGYLKQIFSRSEPKPVFDPITFWYMHKRKYLETCWPLDERDKFERCWELTLKVQSPSLLRGNLIPSPDSLEQKTHQKSDRPIKLKYRGVTYYR